jgi:signal transduction histidine kinase
MNSWLTPDVAAVLMVIGVLPSVLTITLLYEERKMPGVIWFLVSMGTGAAWALVFTLITIIPSPSITLALGNIFWTLIPIASVSLFLLAYEFVFKTTISRKGAALLFSPIAVFFLLTWVNPSNLIYTSEYTVTASGFLSFPQFGGVVRMMITQVYGYLLVIFAAGMFIGEAMRTDGIQRRQTVYLLIIFSTLIVSTIIKVAGVVPIYYDLTSTVYGFSGIFFAYSINRHGFLRTIPTARSQTFSEISDAILVVNENNRVIDVNRAAKLLFGTHIIGSELETFLPDLPSENGTPAQFETEINGEQQHFSVQTSPIDYGRNLTGTAITLRDITRLKVQERELGLLKEILSRMFRHNIRNDLTVINGYTQQIIGMGDDDVVALAEDINEISGHIEGQTKKAGKIEGIITDNTLVDKPLQEFLKDADLSSIPDFGTADIHMDVGTDCVRAHPKFHIAIEELVENAIRHNTTGEVITVEVYTEPTDSGIALIIKDNGPGIPQHEIDVLENQEETSLSHSSGTGLWLVHWIVNYSDGELITETTDSGTLIKIHLNGVNKTVENEA